MINQSVNVTPYNVLELPNRTMNDWYVANLVELGITDDQGNLLPGGGVIEPPR